MKLDDESERTNVIRNANCNPNAPAKNMGKEKASKAKSKSKRGVHISSTNVTVITLRISQALYPLFNAEDA